MNSFKEYYQRSFQLMHKKDPLYRSTSFWEEACINISQEIIESGLDGFRSNETNLNFFVPTYGYPGNSISKEMTEEILSLLEKKGSKKSLMAQNQYLSGYDQALSDFRVLLASNKESDKVDLLSFSESSYGNPIEHFEIENKFYSRSSMNYLLGLSFLKSLLPDFSPRTVLEIGGGFGTLGEILYKTQKGSCKYIDIDLPPIFYIAYQYVKNACQIPEEDIYISSLDEANDEISISQLPTFSFMPSWEIEGLSGEIDLFVNFISFQEMEPPVVQNYLRKVSKLEPKIILLRNMREGKQKATETSIGVNTPVLGDTYKEFLNDYELMDTNVIPYGYKTVDNFNSELYAFLRK